MATVAELKAQAAEARKQAIEVNLRVEELVTAARKANLKAEREEAAARKAEREEAAAKTAAENKAHYERTYAECGEIAGLNEKQHGIVYAQAWEMGHSSGFEKVESLYEDLVEMACAVLKAQ